MSELIEVTLDELNAAAAAMKIEGGMAFEDRRHIARRVLQSINEVRAETAVFRSLSRDLKRLTEANTPYDDQARDLLGSYDITPKP